LFCGKGGSAADARIQEKHILIVHNLCDYIERSFV
jgi:hypothetical protein